jgi:hypothetical protein
MKKALIIIGVIVFVYLLINQLFINTYDGCVFSNSKNESKENGYFISDYMPNKDSVKLNNRIMKSPELWVEKAQESSHFLIFFSKKSIDPNGYNFIINSDSSCTSNEYLIDLKGSFHALNCIKNLGNIYKTQWKSDSVKIYIKQGDSEVGWKKEVIVDSLIYYKN